MSNLPNCTVEVPGWFSYRVDRLGTSHVAVYCTARADGSAQFLHCTLYLDNHSTRADVAEELHVRLSVRPDVETVDALLRAVHASPHYTYQGD